MAGPNRNFRQKRIDLNQVGEAGFVLALLADGFDVPDFNRAAHEAERAGFRTLIASPNKSLVSGRSETREEMNFVVDTPPGDVSSEKFEGLVIPGGERSTKALLASQDIRLLVHDFLKSGKPVLVTGEALELLSELSEKEGVEGDAALAMRGEVFAGSGEDAAESATAAFADALSMVSQAA
ncbi:hypothetical protein GCM10011367_09880 [Marinicauda pacifica]|jgi:putative intracellular protease/amidase|uniref:DJ-1/PfpI domain-containing protein n=1 Tax=Marinicauda pacifica TaxID=1133559 RepID=A0A4S2HFF1_9PROT|nr:MULTISPECIES: DJ-1/PfpI family protein [Marinicauda]TGY94633.1 hypothetical protein E5162_05010 [Marinicauda pacifica]GGE37500.1 hypothetical protein GCM10011367_09880 [Marinicauda pacifica]